MLLFIYLGCTVHSFLLDFYPPYDLESRDCSNASCSGSSAVMFFLNRPQIKMKHSKINRSDCVFQRERKRESGLVETSKIDGERGEKGESDRV